MLRPRTWLQVINSLVWVSSTSVHSLLRKAGTFELCFIVNETQGFQVPHQNAALALAATAAAPRERPQRRRSSSRAPPPNLAERAASRGGLQAARDGQVSELRLCALAPRGLNPSQSGASTTQQRKAIGYYGREGGGSKRGRCLLIRFLCKILYCTGPLA